MELNGSNILITGGTGSLGHALVPRLIKEGVREIGIFSRGENAQGEMARLYPAESTQKYRIKFYIGDVREERRLQAAMSGVDYVIHAAALKSIPACANNPHEALATNVVGSEKVILAAISQGVKKVVAISSDKACEPITLYGATKTMMEQMFTHSNTLHSGRTIFSSVRYGNVAGSNGSILPLILSQRKQGAVTLTDKRSTRFWLQIEDAVQLVITAIELMQGGEVFIPKAPTMKAMDLIEALAPECKVETIGLRAHEKISEVLITPEESRRTVELESLYILEPETLHGPRNPFAGSRVTAGFRYDSISNPWKYPKELYLRDAQRFLEMEISNEPKKSIR